MINTEFSLKNCVYTIYGPKVKLNCRPDGQRRLRRLVKRLLDGAETGLLRLNS